MILQDDQPILQLGPPCNLCKDVWVWVALYRDGEMLTECPCGDPARRHAAFADIDLTRVVSMALIPQQPGLPQVVMQLTDPSMRIVFFRRRYVELNVSSGSQRPNPTIHCLGWQKNLPDGTNVQSYTFVFEDGSVLVTDNRNAV